MVSSSSTGKIKSGFFDRLATVAARSDFVARQRKEEVAANLSVAIAEAGLTQAAVAHAAGISPAQLSKQLSGDANLTLDSIGRICAAIQWEVDLVFRPLTQAKSLQFWERRNQVIHGKFRAHFYEYVAEHDKAWREGVSTDFSGACANTTWNQENDPQPIAA